MISSMNHVSFTVNNLERSVAFYQDVLGLECISIAERDEEFSSAVTGVPNAQMKIAYMKASNCSVELIQYITGAGECLDTKTCNVGSAHICFNIRDYDDWMKRMEKNKVRFRGELCIVPAGPNKGRRVCYMMDDDGNNLEFIEELSREES